MGLYPYDNDYNYRLNSTIVGLKQEERQLLEFMVDAFKQYYSRIETSK